MNETIKTLIMRRSIRKFKPEQIKDEELNLILQAGMNAPSARNQQSALIIVVQNEKMRKRVTELNQKVTVMDMPDPNGKMGKEADPYYGAPTIVLVLGDKTKLLPIEDGSLVLGNMCNAAFSLGIGSCWINREKQMFESAEGKALLKEWGIEGEYIGVGACILGYPDCELPKAAPRKENYVMMVK